MLRISRKLLTIGALAAPLTFSGCDGPKTLDGTVKAEFGIAHRIIESTEASYGTESGIPEYGIILATDKGEFVFSIIDYSGHRPVLGLAQAIEIGDSVRIAYSQSAKVGSDNVDIIDSHSIALRGNH